jgi:pimeloyl-[acyl-carrier protein] synthase
VLSRWDDCVTVLRDPRFGREEFQQMLSAVYGGEESDRLPRSMLFRDPPDHTRLRALVSKAFTPRVVEGMRDHIQSIVDRLLDRVLGRGGMDVIEDLAYPLPVTVICEMLGVPLDDHASIRAWSADIARSLDAIAMPSDPGVAERGRRARRALADCFRALLPERRAHPRSDLLSGLLAAEEQGDKLSEPEVISMCLLLFIAGHETTVNLIGNGTLALLGHPDQLARVQSEPALVANAVEELLRYDSPVQRTARITTTEVDLAGHHLDKGTMVVTALGAANRDPAQFPEPDRLDVTRRDVRHISFGFGIHFCLGAPLARVEGQLALGTLLRRAPQLTLAETSPQWRESSVLRGLKRLRVTF